MGSIFDDEEPNLFAHQGVPRNTASIWVKTMMMTSISSAAPRQDNMDRERGLTAISSD
jgi:hypothetical protein